MGEKEQITGQKQDPAEPAGTAVPDTGSERRDDLFGGESGSSRAEDATRGHGAAPDTGTGADETFGGESGSSHAEDATRGQRAAPDTGAGAPDEVFGGESGSSPQEDATRGHG